MARCAGIALKGSALTKEGSVAARLCRRALSAVLLAILPGGVFASDVAMQSLAICSEATPGTGEVLSQLEEAGWQPVHPSNLSNRDVLGIATRMLGQQMGYGTIPKARWTKSWATISKSAEGTRNRVVIADAPTTSFVLSRLDHTGILEISIGDYPRVAYIFCDITLSESLSEQSLAVVANEQIKPQHPPIIFAQNQELSPEPNHRTVLITYYHREKLAELIEMDLPFVGTISVRNSLQR